MSSEEDNGPVVARFGRTLMVLEEGEYCCVCKAHEDLIRFGLGNEADPLVFTVCNPCFDKGSDRSRFHTWLVAEFEKAFESAPDKWRKNTDGTWRAIKPDEEPTRN